MANETNILDSLLDSATAGDMAPDTFATPEIDMRQNRAISNEPTKSTKELPQDTDGILKHCDADWTTELKPAFCNGYRLSGLAPTRSDNGTPLGGMSLLSGGYNPIDHRDLIAPVSNAGYEFKSGGIVDNGRVLRAEFSLGEETPIGKRALNDIVEARACLVAKNDGTGTARLVLKTFRLWCLNGCTSVQDSVTLKVAHRGDTAGQLKAYGEAVAELLEQWKKTRKVYGILATRSVQIPKCVSTQDMIRVFVAAVRGRAELAKPIEGGKAGVAEKVFESYETAPGQEQVRGTGWGFLNAFTHYTSHKTMKNAEAREVSKLIGAPAKETRQAIDVAYALSGGVAWEDVMDAKGKLMKDVRREVSGGGAMGTESVLSHVIPTAQNVV